MQNIYSGSDSPLSTVHPPCNRLRTITDPLQPIAMISIHEYQVQVRKDQLGVDLISEVLPFRCALLSGENAVADAIDYANLFSGAHPSVIRVYNKAGKLIKTFEHWGRFQRAKMRTNHLVRAANYHECSEEHYHLSETAFRHPNPSSR